MAEMGALLFLSDSLGDAAELAGDVEEYVLAAQLLGAREAIRRSTGAVTPPGFASDPAEPTLRERLGDSRFDELTAQGAAIGVERAVELALGLLDRLGEDAQSPRLGSSAP